MANEVAKASQNFFEKYGEAATQRNIIGDLLLFTKFGEWVHGRDRAKLPMGTSLAANMNTLMVGWVCWEDGQITDERMGPVCEGYIPLKRSELGHLDQTQWEHFETGEPKDPCQPSNKLVLVDLETDAFYTYSTTSKGGLGAIGRLCKQYGKHSRMKPDEVPILELGVSSYQHPEFGEVREPVLEVTGWVAADKLPSIDGASSLGANGGDEPPLALPEPASPASPASASPKAVPTKVAKQHKI
jgi:hypothetical protein